MAVIMSATEAKNKFGQLLEKAQAEPVRIQKDGRDVGIVVSPDEYNRLKQLDVRGPNPLVVEAHTRSVKRWGKVYKALAQ